MVTRLIDVWLITYRRVRYQAHSVQVSHRLHIPRENETHFEPKHRQVGKRRNLLDVLNQLGKSSGELRKRPAIPYLVHPVEELPTRRVDLAASPDDLWFGAGDVFRRQGRCEYGGKQFTIS